MYTKRRATRVQDSDVGREFSAPRLYCLLLVPGSSRDLQKLYVENFF